MSWDSANSLFECLGGLFVWVNVFRLCRDKRTAGISGITTAYFFLWGIWNLFYYPALDQPLSFLGAGVLCGGNLAFVTLMWHFYRKNKDEQEEAKNAEGDLWLGSTDVYQIRKETDL